jgi:L-Ala-D/L-Glu epimerase
VRVDVSVDRARLRTPFISSRNAVTARPLILLRLEGADGVLGHGEAAPLHGYHDVTTDGVLAALDRCRTVLSDADGEDPAAVLGRCAELADLPQALSAIDLALWDQAGRRAGEPVWKLLGADDPRPVAVNATIASADRAGAAREAATAASAGFRSLKVKVAIGDDAGRLAAVRAAVGLDLDIRVDANGAWSVDEALASLRMLEPVGLELCEEPVRGLHATAALMQQTLVPVSIDETAAAQGALDRRWCDAVCLKIAAFGGISGVVRAARQARDAGYQVYLASTLDGPLGIAGALHAAAAIAPDRPCGLATLGQFADRPDPIPAVSGTIALTREPGLGTGLGSWYRTGSGP